MLAYKIFGVQPGFDEGLLFHSCVQDLQSHPDLWLDECPYLDPRLPASLLSGFRVELVNDEERAFEHRVPAPQNQQPQAMSMAA
ncbi:hypothetical protein [Hydrogenophaga sp.]|uniref:hypothetical protein n=1 Tax=Hydrogenophaga sp. TaxID=1904254 RepID=UPI003F70AB36